jgi:hypothetical protein
MMAREAESIDIDYATRLGWNRMGWFGLEQGLTPLSHSAAATTIPHHTIPFAV